MAVLVKPNGLFGAVIWPFRHLIIYLGADPADRASLAGGQRRP
jgi:hypothetical protein